jgi:hypothetical protein
MIQVDPHETMVLVCNDFEVNVNVTDVHQLWQVEFWLSYDTFLLDTLNVIPSSPFFLVFLQINDLSGYVHVVALATTPVSGSGIVVTIIFHCTGAGKSV